MLRANIITDPTAQETDLEDESVYAGLSSLMRDEAPWWLCSFTIHFVGLALLALFAGNIASEAPHDLFAFAPAEIEPDPVPIDDSGPIIVDPPLTNPPPALASNEIALPSESLIDKPTPGQERTDKINVIDPGRVETGLGIPNPGVTGIEQEAFGNHKSGLMTGPRGDPKGTAGTNTPRLGPRGSGGGLGGPPRSNLLRIYLALSWLARHQSPDGSWSLQGYVNRCTDKTCTGQGSVQADSAATALGVLPFLAVGQTHRQHGVHQHVVAGAISWLVRNQRPNGDLRCGATMYAQGLATIALCESYAMTDDKAVGQSAQAAVDFLEAAQNPSTGGWRYVPGDEGDLSVMGWEVMALKSAQMAKLKVNPAVLERAGNYLQKVSCGSRDTGSMGQFAYQPGGSQGTAMSAVGLLCTQYLGAPRNDPVVRSGSTYIMQHLPENSARDLYYWYYASQVMHNQPGPDWDVWNRKTRNLLCDTQCLDGCAKGSWDPQKPVPDRWGAQGGRVMTTSLATLTLEVSLRYLPLYKFEQDGAGQGR